MFRKLPVRALTDVLLAAVQVLLSRFEENPLGEWSALLTQVVRAAMHCQGQSFHVASSICTDGISSFYIGADE